MPASRFGAALERGEISHTVENGVYQVLSEPCLRQSNLKVDRICDGKTGDLFFGEHNWRTTGDYSLYTV